MDEQFLALLRVGLWGKLDESVPVCCGNVHLNWALIVRLAKEQSVQGLVMAGAIDSEITVPEEIAVEFAHWMQALTDRNSKMNCFIAELFKDLMNAGINAVLVKGQGVAQCYNRPLWRSAGDVDLLLDDDGYAKAKKLLISRASSIQKEDISRLHLGMDINGWMVELHGSLKAPHQPRMNKIIEQLQENTFSKEETRIWTYKDVDIQLPSPDNDIIFVFTHILQHFYTSSIGLRQLCDWCRLLWTYSDSIDKVLLKTRLQKMGVMREWRVFAFLAVHNLGMPVDAMPFYDKRLSVRRKANRLIYFIFRMGSFGHNQDMSYIHQQPFFIRKLMSLLFSVRASWTRTRIFPHKAIVFFLRYFFTRTSDAIHGI